MAKEGLEGLKIGMDCIELLIGHIDLAIKNGVTIKELRDQEQNALNDLRRIYNENLN